MTKRLCLSALVMMLASRSPALAADPHTVLQAAIQAMGGESHLRAIHALEYTAVGERQMVEQSERPSGPYFLDHYRVHETRDIDGNRTRIEATHEGYAADHWWTTEAPGSSVLVINGEAAAVVSDGKFAYAGGAGVSQNDDQAAFAPERLLLTAAAASDLRSRPDATLHGVRHHVLAFTYRGIPCTLAINADTNLPWQITYTRAYPYQVFWNAWGDVTTTLTFSAWSLEPDGVPYPREWTYRRVNLPDTQFFIVDLHTNPTLDDAQLTIPRDILGAHPAPTAIDDYKLGYAGDGPAHELAPGITQFPGGWNVEFVKQSDGVVVIEAPWSSNYTKQALAQARRTYGLPVKAVITTSDSWPHIAGVREAVAQGIPVYALDLNGPILKRLLAAPHTMRPDDLQRHPRAAHFILVTNPVTIGSGPDRLVIYPYRTQTGERQMMVFAPAPRLLYTSDLFSMDSGPTDWFTPQYLAEAIGAIDRYHLAPRTIFGMHYGPTPYQTILDIVRGTRG
jgi:hypothetical protein